MLVCNPSTWDADQRELWVQSQPELYSKTALKKRKEFYRSYRNFKNVYHLDNIDKPGKFLGRHKLTKPRGSKYNTYEVEKVVIKNDSHQIALMFILWTIIPLRRVYTNVSFLNVRR